MQSATSGEPTTEIVVQAPESQNPVRSIPLLPAGLMENRCCCICRRENIVCKSENIIDDFWRAL